MFALTMFPNALWGLAMPTLQAITMQHVSGSEPGQLQGATMSVASIAGVVSPLFFGAVYAATTGEGAIWAHPGASFLISGAVLLSAAIIGWRVARRTRADAKAGAAA